MLLASEDDEVLKSKIDKIFYSFDSSFKPLVENPTEQAFRKLIEKYIKLPTTDAANAGLYICFYLMYDKYGEDGGNALYHQIYKDICEEIAFHEEQNPTSYREAMLKVEQPFDYIDMDEKLWKFAKRITNSVDLLECSNLMDEVINNDNHIRKQQIADELHRLSEISPIYADSCYELANLVYGYASIAEYFGFSPTKVLQKITVTKSDQMIILKAIAFQYSRVWKVVDGKKGKLKSPTSISLELYLSLVVIYMLIKSIAETKQYYIENNNETLFSQVKYYREEKERQDAEIERLKAELAEEKERSRLLREEVQSSSTSNTKPFLEEISSLNKRVEDLTASLVDKQKDDAELHRLREFAFSLETEYLPDNNDITLAELLNGKKICIIGGHINWRNKLKKQYPSLITVDGNGKTLDFSFLEDVDMVLFYTSHMGHGVYEKAMSLIRKKSIPFDYIGKAVNPDLVEKEIAEILTKQPTA